MIALILADAN